MTPIRAVYTNKKQNPMTEIYTTRHKVNYRKIYDFMKNGYMIKCISVVYFRVLTALP